MSIMERDRWLRKLRTPLSRARDEDFCQLVWAVNELQTDNVDVAAPFIDYPKEAATSDIASEYSVHKWELETLVTELLLTAKAQVHPGRVSRTTNCALFGVAAEVVNALRNLENAEAGVYLKRFGILSEIHRIGQRQFPWQRGYYDVPQFYRYGFIYGRGESASYFEQEHGLAMGTFSLVGYALYIAFGVGPIMGRSLHFLEPLGVTPSIAERAFALFVKPISEARSEAARLVREVNAKQSAALPVAYLPSSLRRWPVLAFGKNGERLRVPLRQLLAYRVTAGIYYDLVSGGAHLRNDASKRFEEYCRDYLKAMLPGLVVSGSRKYKVRNNFIESPDVLVRDHISISMAIECKATKLTFGAQFAEDAVDEAASAYHEIAKGIFQLWRFFSHARRGLVGDVVSPTARGLIITLDTWLVMARPLKEHVLAAASELADKDEEILEQDRRPVVFCSISDIESTLMRISGDSFLRAVDAASEERYMGWMLPEVAREEGLRLQERRPYPFTLNTVLPWWGALDELRSKAK